MLPPHFEHFQVAGYKVKKAFFIFAFFIDPLHVIVSTYIPSPAGEGQGEEI